MTHNHVIQKTKYDGIFHSIILYLQHSLSLREMPKRTLNFSLTIIFFSLLIVIIIVVSITNSSSEIHSTTITEIEAIA